MADRLDDSYSNQWYEYLSFTAAAEEEETRSIALEAQERCRNLGIPPEELKFYFFYSKSYFMAINELISHIVHDLKNPLAVIRGMSQLANLKLNPNNEYHYFDNIIKQVDVMDKIISDLLAIFRVEKRLKLSPISIIQKELESLKTFFQSKELQISFISDSDFSIPLCQKLFERTIHNLIYNCLHALPSGGRLLISCRKKQNNMVLSLTPATPDIESNGSPLDLFMSGDKQQKERGLELFLANYCARVHCGKLWIENLPQKGTTLYMSLPLQ